MVKRRSQAAPKIPAVGVGMRTRRVLRLPLAEMWPPLTWTFVSYPTSDATLDTDGTIGYCGSRETYEDDDELAMGGMPAMESMTPCTP